MNNPAHNIYIHVPFCMSKCNYCAFFSRACSAPDWVGYSRDICAELEHWARALGRIDVPTVFFGGGTPSLMPTDTFAEIMGCVRKNFNLLSGAEVTLESNPGTLDAMRLREFMSHGVNRLSVGVQSLDDDKLKFMGRRHSASDALRLLDAAHNLGLRVSADFIYGLPDETVSDVVRLCGEINTLGLKHCSLYELTIEPNTPFGKMHLTMPDNETMAAMYTAIDEYLKLSRYEVSNYCAPDNECKHNLNIWGGAPYIGVGAGAAGRVFTNNTWFEQTGNFETYSPISNSVRATECVITGLRTVRGCLLTDSVKKVIDMDWVHMHPELITVQDNRIATTADGMLVLDDVLVNLVK